MFGINDIAQYIELHTQEKVYPLVFSLDSPTHASTVQFNGGQPAQAGISRVNLQVITRSDHPAAAEQRAMQIKTFLNQQTNVQMGSAHIIYVAAENPFPLYIGTDENGRYRYSMNYQLLIEGV